MSMGVCQGAGAGLSSGSVISCQVLGFSKGWVQTLGPA